MTGHSLLAQLGGGRLKGGLALLWWLVPLPLRMLVRLLVEGRITGLGLLPG
jgi:hypothetical protein